LIPRCRNQDGAAMVFVILVGLVISLAFSLFMTSTVLVESRAVEGELAKSRAYWAEMGTFHYVMSRISQSKFCSSCVIPNTNIKDSVLAVNLQSYFNELSNLQTWTYPDESSSYSITISTTAAADDTRGRQIYSGWLMATSAYTGSSVVNGINTHLPLEELRLCVGLNNTGAKCGNILNNNGGKTTGYFSVNRLTNLPS
jgi:hypothetical protein